MRRLGIDENGLGAQLGPLIVTAVEAEVDPSAERLFQRKLPRTLRADLDDSKALVSCHDVSLGEAWARVAVARTRGVQAESPQQLLAALFLSSEQQLRRDCPAESEPQCWPRLEQEWCAEPEVLGRLEGHLDHLERRGLCLLSVKTEVVCSSRLSALRRQGVHRFAADLAAMERLLLSSEDPARPFVATCGKVGGIGKYGDFFSLLAGRLHTPLVEGRALSSYHFPQLGEIRFLRDADAKDPLVMLASLIGKYVREAFMTRIARFYGAPVDASPSGYHDPVTARFVVETQTQRKRLHIAENCFIRSREELPTQRSAERAQSAAQGSRAQGSRAQGSRAQGSASAPRTARGKPRAAPGAPGRRRNPSQGELF